MSATGDARSRVTSESVIPGTPTTVVAVSAAGEPPVPLPVPAAAESMTAVSGAGCCVTERAGRVSDSDTRGASDVVTAGRTLSRSPESTSAEGASNPPRPRNCRSASASVTELGDPVPAGTPTRGSAIIAAAVTGRGLSEREELPKEDHAYQAKVTRPTSTSRVPATSIEVASHAGDVSGWGFSRGLVSTRVSEGGDVRSEERSAGVDMGK
jgi:hypothetical protein